MRKNAQIHIGETIAVVFVFFILFIFGLIFYTGIAKTRFKTAQSELSEIQSIEIAQKAAFLPELQYSEDNIARDAIDMSKLTAAERLMQQNPLHYFDIFGYAEITVTEIYPKQRTWQLYSRPLDEFTSKLSTQIPVPLYDPLADLYSFAYLEINAYKK